MLTKVATEGSNGNLRKGIGTLLSCDVANITHAAETCKLSPIDSNSNLRK